MSETESYVLLTAAQMRSTEQAAIDSGAVTGLELMERAGRGVVEAIFAEWPELQAAPHKAVVLCGPGNNGGDGFVVARLLRDWGWEVEVFLYGDPDNLPPDARVNYQRWLKMGEVIPYRDDDFWLEPTVWDTETVLVDALFGTGLTRPVSGFNEVAWVTQISEWALSSSNQLKAFPGCRIVAVDVPSGLDSDSGKYLITQDPRHEDFRADLTVTFHRCKLGHLLHQGPKVCGTVVVADIGLSQLSSGAPAPFRPRPAPSLGTSAPEARRGGENAPTLGPGANLRTNVARLASPALVAKPKAAHKYSHGHALILSGPIGRSGAARLAARAALRVGAGLVTVAAPGSAMMGCAAQLTAIMLRKCDGAEGLAALLDDKRLNALCLGPGLGMGQATRDMVAAALTQSGQGGTSRRPTRRVVLDADALTSFAEDPEALFDLIHEYTVLTPHGGEFARLFPDIAKKLSAPATTGPAYSKLDACRDAAARAGCTVLFKGPDTVIADPSGRAAINAAVYDRAAPWLATAGSGDVLAGLITGLMARGVPAFTAAETGAWLHTEAARAFGPGLIAEDLPEMLPKVFRDLGL